MPQLSKRRIEPEVKQDLIDSLSYILKELRTKKEVDIFLSSVLTDTERLMISKRVVTAYLINKNIEDKKIGNTLKLTQTSIRRLKMWIELRNEGYNLVFRKLDKKSTESLAKEILNKILNYSIKAAFGLSPKPF